MRLSPTRFISIAGTEVHAAVSNAADGKTALKEIKQKKSEYALKRRALLYQQKQAKVAAEKAEGSPAKKKKTGLIATLGRWFGKARAVKPKRTLAEIEAQIVEIDEILYNLDSCKVQIEGKLLAMG